MAHVVRQDPEAQLTIVGDGLYEDASNRINDLHEMVAELGLAQHIFFVGRKPHPEVARLMQESSVFVLPSRRETFGKVLVEALACGTPVVATRCGGPEDIVTDEVGVLVQPEDATALAEGVLSVLNAQQAYEPARLAAYAAARFSWSKVAGQMVALYHDAVSGF